MAPHRPPLPQPRSSPATDQPARFFSTMIICSVAPLVIALLLPQPWRDAFLPLGEFMLAFVFFFGLALLLHGLSLLWNVVRPRHKERLVCPVCHTYEQGRLRFDVVRIAPAIYRLHCPECGERWVEQLNVAMLDYT